MIKKISATVVIIVLFIIGFYFGHQNQNHSGTVKRKMILMGTTVEIIIRGVDESDADVYFRDGFKEFERIDSLFSAYIDGNSVSDFNESPKDTFIFPVEVVELLKKSIGINEKTFGSFDVAIGRLSEIWGFYSHKPVLPAPDMIRKELLKSGDNNISIIDDSTVVKKESVHLNFGAITKGYAVDKAFLQLKNMGLDNFLINAGGEIRAIGKDWVIGVQSPRDLNDIVMNLKPENNEISVATSGDYENYFIQDNIRYNHIINPATGYPSQECQSVTIVGKDVTTADALATAVFVLGPVKGLQVIESLPETECIIIDNKGKIITSSGFNKFIRR